MVQLLCRGAARFSRAAAGGMKGGIAASAPDYNVDRVIFKARRSHSRDMTRRKRNDSAPKGGARPRARTAQSRLFRPVAGGCNPYRLVERGLALF